MTGISKTVLPLLAMAIMTSACNKVKNRLTTVVRDCTGTYIRYDGVDYKVCNTDKTDKYANGDQVKASFKKIKSCNSNGVSCAMLHESNGWIEVQKISAQ